MTNRSVATSVRNRELVFSDTLPNEFQEAVKPPTSISALGFWLFFLGVGLLGSLGIWASISPIQSAVVAAGTFEVKGDHQIVEHLEGGIVREIFVHEGDEVEAGQIIAKLDSTRVDAQVNIWQGQLAAMLARDARLRAEFDQADTLVPSQELLDLIAIKPAYQEILNTQIELFLSNRLTDTGQIAIFTKRTRQLNEQIAGIDNRRDKLQKQLEIVQEEVEDLEALFEKGLAVKARVTTRQKDELILVERIGQADSEVQSALQEIAEVEQRSLQIGRQRRYTIANERQQASEQIVDIRERLIATREVLDRLEIRAPVAGRLIGFEQNSIGEVIEEGQTLLEIVPRDSTFIVKARVGTADIDEVAMDGPARVRLSAYSFRKTPPVDGHVTYIAADATFDEANDQSYYEVRIELNEDALANLPSVHAVPGMPAQVMIATGEQTIMTYLLDPVLGGFETALIEGE